MRKLVTLVAALVLTWPFASASKEVPGLTVLKDPDRVAYTAYFTTSTEAGVYYIGTAFPTAVLDFEFGSDFSGILYACDTPDGAGDDDLSDDAECVALATLATADLTVDPLKAKKLWYVLDINTAGTATLTIKGTWDQVSSSGGGAWDSEVDVATSSQPCVDINNAIADAMDTSTTGFTRVRVHMGSADSFSLTVEDDYEDLGPYKACIALHPLLDSTNGYPVPGTTTDYRASLASEDKLFLFFDNIRPSISEAGMTENAVFLDLGAGYLAGHNGSGTYYGRLGEGVHIEGVIDGVVATANAGSFDDEVIPSPSGAARLNADSTSAHAWVASNGATYIKAGGLTVWSEGTDNDDQMCNFSNSWGSSLPNCRSKGAGEGVGIQFHGIINSDLTGQIRQLDYGVVLGSPDKRGDVVYYSSCYGEACTDDEQGVRGVTWEDGVIEGNQQANFVDIGSDARNIFRDIHWECGTGCDKAAYLIKPHFCDGSSGTTPVAEDIPVVADEATECAASGGVAAAAPETDADGTLVFAGRLTASGDSDTTNSVSPSFMFGEDFTHGKKVAFHDGVIMGKATDSSNNLLTFHSSLTRAGQASPLISIADSVGCVDTSGAEFASPLTVFPGNYDCWIDAREETFLRLNIVSPAGNTASAVNSAGGSDLYISWTDFANYTDATSATACTGGTVFNSPLRAGSERYLTRALIVPGSGLSGDESCAIGIHELAGVADCDPGTGTTLQTILHFPPVTGDDFDSVDNDSWFYPLGFLQEVGNNLALEIGTGDYSQTQSTPTCASAGYGALLEIRGFPFDPFD